jgi:hypothetical protein
LSFKRASAGAKCFALHHGGDLQRTRFELCERQIKETLCAKGWHSYGRDIDVDVVKGVFFVG